MQTGPGELLLHGKFKMKKQIMIIMLALLLVGSTIAISFSNKENLIDAFMTYKAQRENTIKSIALEITYTSDKSCWMDYDVEALLCEVCFDYKYSEKTYEKCLGVPHDFTSQETDNIIKDYVENEIRDLYPIESYTYTEEGYNGRVLK